MDQRASADPLQAVGGGHPPSPSALLSSLLYSYTEPVYSSSEDAAPEGGGGRMGEARSLSVEGVGGVGYSSRGSNSAEV